MERGEPYLVTLERTPLTSRAGLAVARGAHELGTSAAGAADGPLRRIRPGRPYSGNTQEEAP